MGAGHSFNEGHLDARTAVNGCLNTRGSSDGNSYPARTREGHIDAAGAGDDHIDAIRAGQGNIYVSPLADGIIDVRHFIPTRLSPPFLRIVSHRTEGQASPS